MPKKGINIYKRKDGRWEARIIRGHKADGKPKYRSVYGKTYAEVKRKQAEVLAGIIPEEKKPDGREGATFAKATADWLAAVALRSKESTYTKYERLWRTQILPQLGPCRLSGNDAGQNRTLRQRAFGLRQAGRLWRIVSQNSPGHFDDR